MEILRRERAAVLIFGDVTSVHLCPEDLPFERDLVIASLQLWDSRNHLLRCLPHYIRECVMREHSMVSSPLSLTFVMSARKIRIYMIKLAWLILGKKDDSLMLLGLLAGYWGRKKRTLDPCDPLSIQIHPETL